MFMACFDNTLVAADVKQQNGTLISRLNDTEIAAAAKQLVAIILSRKKSFDTRPRVNK